jgi:coenzyme F420-reducing hydrogenase alpha subunit
MYSDDFSNYPAGSMIGNNISSSNSSNRANFHLRKYINYIYSIEGMRGRWAAAAVGAGVAKSRAGAKANQQAQAAQAQQQASQQQIEAQQRQIEAMQQQKQQPQSQSQPQQEDITQKLQKYADLHQKGILSDEEFQKLKADLLSKM